MMNRFLQPIALNIGHAIAKGSDTRQYHMTRMTDHIRIPRHHRLMPHRLKGFGHTAEITHAVIDNRDHGAFLEDAETITRLTRPTQTRRDASARRLLILLEAKR